MEEWKIKITRRRADRATPARPTPTRRFVQFAQPFSQTNVVFFLHTRTYGVMGNWDIGSKRENRRRLLTIET